MRVLLADDHRLFRAGMRELLTRHGFEITAEAGDGAEAVARVRVTRPDVVLMDLNMPGIGGLQATRLLKAEFAELPVVILTASEEEQDLFEAVKSGAQGYLLKSLDPTTVVDLVQAAARGEPALTPQLAAKILSEFARAQTPPPAPAMPAAPAPARPGAGDPEMEPLTAREREVLELLVAGATNKELAQRLIVSENTVKYHLKNILQKLHLSNRAQVVAYALRHGLTRPSGG
ncbi:MAG: response regulator transcription factor [Chloroflexi bacterium]|nr:response regulator transcription factor [Chloroflexota bacterium]